MARPHHDGPNFHFYWNVSFWCSNAHEARAFRLVAYGFVMQICKILASSNTNISEISRQMKG